MVDEPMSDTTPATLSPEELEAVIAAAADALYKRGWPWYFPTTDSESFSECQRKHTIEDFSKIMRAHFAAHAAPTTPPGTESPRPAESTATRGALEDAADIIYRLARAIDSQRRCMGMEDAREIAAVVSAALAAPTPAAATPAPAGEAGELRIVVRLLLDQIEDDVRATQFFDSRIIERAKRSLPPARQDAAAEKGDHHV